MSRKNDKPLKVEGEVVRDRRWSGRCLYIYIKYFAIVEGPRVFYVENSPSKSNGGEKTEFED